MCQLGNPTKVLILTLMNFFCSENGELYLAVKVVDQEVNRLDRVGCLAVKLLVDQGDLVQVSTDGVLVAPVTTLEGEHIPLHPVPINFGISGGDCSEVLFVSVSPRFLRGGANLTLLITRHFWVQFYI